MSKQFNPLVKYGFDESGTATNGVPTGGTTGQVLAKINGTNFNTEWVDPSGAVDSVNGDTGTVVLNHDDIGDGTTYKQYSATEKTKLAGIEASADVTDAGNVGSSIHGATAKTTPVDADTTPLIDSEASNVLKKVTWANIKATLKTYFDTLYSTFSGSYTDLTNKPTIDTLLPTQTGNTGKYLKTDGTNAAWDTPAGSLLNNYSATTNPAVTDDTGDGYSVGSIWINLTTDIAYQCTDASTGAAVWKEIISADASQTISNKTFVGGTFNGQTLNNPRLQAVDEFYIDNNVSIKGRNQADNANVEMFKITTSDALELLNNLTLGTKTVGDATPADLTKLHALTADSTELNYIDGVTSAIQTQLNSKAPLASPTFTGTVTLPTGLTGVIRADTGVVSVDTDITDLVSASSDTAAGKVELATITETTTGTDTGRAVTPDGLAGSVYGKRVMQLKIIDDTTTLTTGDGKLIFCITPELNGYNLVDADAYVTTVSSSGTPTIQIRNITDTVDMLSTLITIDASETTSYTAVAQPVIDATKDDVATGDLLAIDVDVAGTGAKGLGILLTFQLP